MAVLREEHRRPIARRGVELRARGQVREALVRPAAADDPRAERIRIGDPLLHRLERLEAGQIDCLPRKTARDERDVRVVESGDHRRALCVDDGRLWTAIAEDLAVRADVQDLVPAHRDRFGHRPEAVGSVKLCVVDDEIDRAAVVVALRADDQARDERGRDDRDNDVCGETRGHAPSGRARHRAAPMVADREF